MLLDTDGLPDGFLVTWVQIILDHCQHVFITTSEEDTSQQTVLDMQMHKTVIDPNMYVNKPLVV